MEEDDAWEGVGVEWLSSIWMSVEVVGSIAAGLLAGSLALLAFGADSLIELFSDLVVLNDLRGGLIGSEIHRDRAELAVTVLLASLIPSIGLGMVYSYLSDVRPEASLPGIIVALGAVVVMPYLWYQKRRIGRDTSTPALSIDAVESAACLLMASTLLRVLVG